VLLASFNWSIRDWMSSLLQTALGALAFLSVADDFCTKYIGLSLLGGRVLLLVDMLTAIYPVVL
jgi:hypothetical protein